MILCCYFSDSLKHFPSSFLVWWTSLDKTCVRKVIASAIALKSWDWNAWGRQVWTLPLPRCSCAYVGPQLSWVVPCTWHLLQVQLWRLLTCVDRQHWILSLPSRLAEPPWCPALPVGLAGLSVCLDTHVRFLRLTFSGTPSSHCWLLHLFCVLETIFFPYFKMVYFVGV